MINPLQDTILKSVENPQNPPVKEWRCGMVLRYDTKLWKENDLKAYRTAFTCNTLLLALLESLPHKELSQGPRGIEANFVTKTEAIEAAIALQSFLVERSIPASIVLYSEEGFLDEKGGWHCGGLYVAEKIAFYSPSYEIRLKSSFMTGFLPPQGTGVFHLKRTKQIYYEDDLHVLKNYELEL